PRAAPAHRQGGACVRRTRLRRVRYRGRDRCGLCTALPAWRLRCAAWRRPPDLRLPPAAGRARRPLQPRDALDRAAAPSRGPRLVPLPHGTRTRQGALAVVAGDAAGTLAPARPPRRPVRAVAAAALELPRPGRLRAPARVDPRPLSSRPVAGARCHRPAPATRPHPGSRLHVPRGGAVRPAARAARGLCRQLPGPWQARAILVVPALVAAPRSAGL